MAISVSWKGKLLLAYVAREWLFLDVCARMVPCVAQLREGFLARCADIRNVDPLRSFVHHSDELEAFLFADRVLSHRRLTTTLRRVNRIRLEAWLGKVDLTKRHIHPLSLLFFIAGIDFPGIDLRLVRRDHLAFNLSYEV